METRIALFQKKGIRKSLHAGEWWFVIVDVVAALTDSANPTDYLNKVRRRDPELAKGYGQIVHPLLIETAGGKQKLNCANTEGLFRLIQSIPKEIGPLNLVPNPRGKSKHPRHPATTAMRA